MSVTVTWWTLYSPKDKYPPRISKQVTPDGISYSFTSIQKCGVRIICISQMIKFTLWLCESRSGVKTKKIVAKGMLCTQKIIIRSMPKQLSCAQIWVNQSQGIKNIIFLINTSQQRTLLNYGWRLKVISFSRAIYSSCQYKVRIHSSFHVFMIRKCTFKQKRERMALHFNVTKATGSENYLLTLTDSFYFLKVHQITSYSIKEKGKIMCWTGHLASS